ncbi:hypothetical protein FRB99_003095 [Tulasnella sp. 403]|nr:hypothetical protein FRB99_003095 [Tulasnella sp. 403]
MAHLGEELAFLKTQALSLRDLPVTLPNDYQPALEDIPKRVLPFPVALPPHNPKAPSSRVSPPTGISIVVKSTKPSLSFPLTVNSTDTIAQIKELLAKEHPRAPPANIQRLLLKGKVLSDNKLLKEYPIASSIATPTIITLMTKPGSTWTGEEKSATTAPVESAIVTTEPESFAQPSPTRLPPPAHARHARSLSGQADSMPLPSLTLSPTPSPEGTAAGGASEMKLDMDLNLLPDPPRGRTPKAEAFHQVITDPDFWTRLLEFLSKEFKTPEDATTAWEEFFLASKSHLTPHEIAKIRDVTGVVAMAGL